MTREPAVPGSDAPFGRSSRHCLAGVSFGFRASAGRSDIAEKGRNIICVMRQTGAAPEALPLRSSAKGALSVPGMTLPFTAARFPHRDHASGRDAEISPAAGPRRP